ncbi:YitT family protein [Priestia megaterium]|nr:YitT family protein [Priestia megaterium]
MAICCGSLLIGLGLNGFIAPYHLLDGGLIGFGLIVYYMIGLPIGVSILLLNIPVFIYAFFRYRHHFFYGSAGLLVSFFITEKLAVVNGSLEVPLLFSSIIGGTLVGMGIGLMLRYQISSDGLDLIALIISSKWQVNVAAVIFLLDSLIMLTGLPIVGFTAFCYSMIVILMSSLMIMLFNSRKWMP